MPYSVHKSDECPASRPWACVKEGGEVMGCHASKSSAQAQQRALYAVEQSALSGDNSNNETHVPYKLLMSAKELHDQWLDQKPEGASHDPGACPFCEVKPPEEPEKSMSDKTFSEEEVAAKVAAALKPLEDRIAAYEAEQAEGAVEAKIAEAVEPLEAKVAELQKDLDVKIAEADAAKAQVEEIEAYLAAEEAAKEEAAAREERQENRRAQVKEHANYTDEHIEANLERWTDMEDAEFAGFIEDLKAAGVKPAEKPKDDVIPDKTGLKAARETAAAEGRSKLGAIRSLREAGYDARRI